MLSDSLSNDPIIWLRFSLYKYCVPTRARTSWLSGIHLSHEVVSEIIKRQNQHSLNKNKLTIDNTYKVLVEGVSKKSNNFLKGKTSENKLVVFPQKENLIGTYVDVKVKECNSATLFGETC